MKKQLIKRIKEKIELNWRDYADAYIAEWVNKGIKGPEAEKQIELAREKMPEIKNRIDLLSKLLKELNESK